MTTFAELLAELPSVDHLAAIELLPETGGATVRIENKPGQAGSLRVYHALFQRFGEIDPLAAEEGLRLYAEHTADARVHPGKHPNIDRLIAIIAGGTHYRVTLIAR